MTSRSVRARSPFPFLLLIGGVVGAVVSLFVDWQAVWAPGMSVLVGEVVGGMLDLWRVHRG